MPVFPWCRRRERVTLTSGTEVVRGNWNISPKDGHFVPVACSELLMQAAEASQLQKPLCKTAKLMAQTLWPRTSQWSFSGSHYIKRANLTPQGKTWVKKSNTLEKGNKNITQIKYKSQWPQIREKILSIVLAWSILSAVRQFGSVVGASSDNRHVANSL